MACNDHFVPALASSHRASASTPHPQNYNCSSTRNERLGAGRKEERSAHFHCRYVQILSFLSPIFPSSLPFLLVVVVVLWILRERPHQSRWQ